MEELTFSRFIREFNEADKEMNIIYHRLARHYRLSDSVFWVLYLLGRPGAHDSDQAVQCAVPQQADGELPH